MRIIRRVFTTARVLPLALLVITLCLTTWRANSLTVPESSQVGVLEMHRQPWAVGSEADHRVYLPVAIQPFLWQPVVASGQEQLPSPADEFRKFYDIAQCGGWLFAGANTGLFRLNDAQGWVPVVGNSGVPSNKNVYGIDFGNESCDELYVAIDGSGIWRGVLEEQEWVFDQIDPKGDGDAAAFDVLTVGKRLYAAGRFGIRYWDLPVGNSDWKVTNVEQGQFVVGLYANADQEETVWAALFDDGVYEVDPDDPAAWTELDYLDDLAGVSPGVYAASRNRDGVIAGTASALVVGNLQTGNWDLPTNVVESTTFDVLATDNLLFAGQRTPQVLFSPDGGTSWYQLPHFPDTTPDGNAGFQVRGLEVGSDGHLYAATTSGAWKSQAPIIADDSMGD